MIKLDIRFWSHPNETAIYLYDRFGFEQEGRRRHFAFRDGDYVDVFAMAQLDDVPLAQTRQSHFAWLAPVKSG